MYRLMRLVRLPVDIACAAVSGAIAAIRRMMNAAPIERKQ